LGRAIEVRINRERVEKKILVERLYDHRSETDPVEKILRNHPRRSHVDLDLKLLTLITIASLKP